MSEISETVIFEVMSKIFPSFHSIESFLKLQFKVYKNSDKKNNKNDLHFDHLFSFFNIHKFNRIQQNKYI